MHRPTFEWCKARHVVMIEHQKTRVTMVLDYALKGQVIGFNR